MDDAVSNGNCDSKFSTRHSRCKKTAIQVSNRIQAIRQKKTHEELCNSYEELINELVAERAQAIAIAQAYKSELNRYEIDQTSAEQGWTCARYPAIFLAR